MIDTIATLLDEIGKKSGKKLMANDNPIALIHWGDPAVEDEEIDEVKLLLEATLFGGDLSQQAKKSPWVSELRVTTPNARQMADQLGQFFSRQQNLQILYFSCHGSTAGFHFSCTADIGLTFEHFGEILRKTVGSDECLHVVLGSCHAMASPVHVEKFMPDQVYCVSGFTECPLSTDVAGLIAGVFHDDVVVFAQLAVANDRTCGTGVTEEEAKRVVEVWKQILDQHDPKPTQEVLGTKGVAVVQASRTESGQWTRRIFSLENR